MSSSLALAVIVGGGDDVDLWCKRVNVMDVDVYSPEAVCCVQSGVRQVWLRYH